MAASTAGTAAREAGGIVPAAETLAVAAAAAGTAVAETAAMPACEAEHLQRQNRRMREALGIAKETLGQAMSAREDALVEAARERKARVEEAAARAAAEEKAEESTLRVKVLESQLAATRRQGEQRVSIAQLIALEQRVEQQERDHRAQTGQMMKRLQHTEDALKERLQHTEDALKEAMRNIRALNEAQQRALSHAATPRVPAAVGGAGEASALRDPVLETSQDVERQTLRGALERPATGQQESEQQRQRAPRATLKRPRQSQAPAVAAVQQQPTISHLPPALSQPRARGAAGDVTAGGGGAAPGVTSAGATSTKGRGATASTAKRQKRQVAPSATKEATAAVQKPQPRARTQAAGGHLTQPTQPLRQQQYSSAAGVDLSSPVVSPRTPVVLTEPYLEAAAASTDSRGLPVLTTAPRLDAVRKCALALDAYADAELAAPRSSVSSAIARTALAGGASSREACIVIINAVVRCAAHGIGDAPPLCCGAMKHRFGGSSGLCPPGVHVDGWWCKEAVREKGGLSALVWAVIDAAEHLKQKSTDAHEVSLLHGSRAKCDPVAPLALADA